MPLVQERSANTASAAAPAPAAPPDTLVDPLQASAQPGARQADVPRQKISDLSGIYAQARDALPDFQKRVNGVAGATKGVASFPPATEAGKGSGPNGELDEDDKLGLKGKNRAKEKIAADYVDASGKEDTARLVDVLRGSVVYQTMDDLEKGKKGIASQFKVVREKDRFQKGKDQDGYRDVNYNLETPNGHIAEVQLHLEQILQAKSGKGAFGKNDDGRSGHGIYEELRALEAKKKDGFADIKDDEQRKAQLKGADKRIAELKTESKAHYDKAFKAAGGKTDDQAPPSV